MTEPPPISPALAWGDLLARNTKAITVIGVPALIAAFLTWWLTTQVVARLQRIETAITLSEQRRLIEESRASAYWYAICLNSSSTDTDRARCAIANAGRPTSTP